MKTIFYLPKDRSAHLEESLEGTVVNIETFNHDSTFNKIELTFDDSDLGYAFVLSNSSGVHFGINEMKSIFKPKTQ